MSERESRPPATRPDFLTRRVGTGSLLDLHDNPLVAWALRRAKRDPRAYGIAIVYILFVHGAAGIMLTLMAAPGFGLRFQEFAIMTHTLTWAANAFLFCVWVPTRYAQHLGTEREKKTLDFLRMTRVPSRKICIGAFAAAYLVPVMAGLTSIPEVLVGCFSRKTDYLPGVLQAYLGLASTSLIATSLAGLISFVPKKGIQAASSAFFAVILLAVLGGAYAVPFFEPLGCLAPWGGLMSGLAPNEREAFLVTLCGETLPGVVLQVPVALALAFIFLDATTRKIHEEGPGFLGAKDATRFAVLVGLVCAVTLAPHSAVQRYYYSSIETAPLGPLIAGRFLIMLVVMMPLAADASIHREEVVRGMARAPGPPRADERLEPWRPILAIVLVSGLVSALMAIQAPRKDAIATAVAGAVLASALSVVHVVFQAARLFFSQQTRNVMGIVGVGVLWFVPLLGSWGSGVLDLPRSVTVMPSMLCPFVSIMKAAVSADRRFAIPGEVDPTAMALVAVLLNVLLTSGGLAVLRELTGRLTEFAASLSVLPADVFAPAGKLEKKCDRGHIYAGLWDTCPHCAPAPPSAD